METGGYSETAMRYFARRTGPIYPTLAAELLEARASLTLAESITLAVRADRRRRGLSQRAYAFARGWSKTFVARLEADPARMTLQQVVEALDGTDHRLCLRRQPEPEPEPAADQEPRNHSRSDSCDEAAEAQGVLVDARSWPAGEMLARTAAGRRLPGHREIRRTTGPAWRAGRDACVLTPPPGPDWTTGVG